MGFLELFSVASFPVIKVLLVTGIGLLLALDNINLLGKDARNQTNHLVHYVFNPGLIGGNLAQTITLDNVVSLWFMPVNILVTFLLGSALGWIIIKLTKPPRHIEGLIVGVCSAGNLGNLPIIIIPAICKDKGSPFGDPDVCYQFGMAYASLSMAIGAVFIWTYVYNIMRISSRNVHKECNKSSDSITLEDSRDVSQSIIEEGSENYTSPTKGNVDDAYTLLLSKNESEQKIKVPVFDKIKHKFGMILGNPNFRGIFSPATLGAIVGFIVGVVPWLRRLMIGSNAPLHVIEDSASMLGDAAIPTITLIMGANLLRGLKGASTPFWTIIGIIVVRYILLPIFGVLIIKGATHLGLVQIDPLYQFVLLLQYALPPAMNIGTIAQLFGAGESECSVMMLWTYALASIAVTLWSTYFMWLVS
ncbi:putative membrane transport protein [Medicago truncatula]|uniref:Auxin efflux carrier family protein n=1 Tax=Medicago truncatula TaxID=3880 RepID=G7K2M6_MEDTR|nr:protein PIN-LIKES 3 [Medicago truncatula]XP_024640454.1 protein PIN-LIKES 3 [Medicago truncatula]XP_039690539.1 protein PIN-LIKES 3 [Medicago truncatula]AES95389.1 auxin efflux carrier family protein [Medicago truncatula]RHN54504.1 putative membrane transport protein [Medicago truncatula]